MRRSVYFGPTGDRVSPSSFPNSISSRAFEDRASISYAMQIADPSPARSRSVLSSPPIVGIDNLRRGRPRLSDARARA